jgi:hypothetical protein
MLALAVLLGTMSSRAAFFGPLDSWTRVHPYPNLSAAAFGANRFVAVGELGGIQSSADGSNWVTHPLNSIAYFNDVIFAGSRFVAVGSIGAIRISPNGTNWTQVSSGGTSTHTGVAFGNGLYVIVTQSGTALTSTNGTNWASQVIVSPAQSFVSVAYGSNIFAAITGAGNIFTSPDGTNWSSQTPQGGTPSRIAWVNNRFVLVDYGMKVSLDGTNWSAPNYVYPVLTNIVYAGGYYVGVGSAIGSGHGGAILFSPDLTTWTTAVDDAHTFGFSGLAYGNGRFVATGLRGLVRTSNDRTNWPITGQSLTYLGNLYGIKYINNQFMAVGNGAVSPGGFGEDSPYLFSGSPTWTRRPSGIFSGIWDLAYGQGRYVVANSFGIQTSTNGLTWSSASSVLGGQLAGLTFANNLFVLTASSGGVSTSPDGVAWTVRTSNTTRTLWATAYGNGMYVSVGNSSSGGAYITSGDGINWTNHTLSTVNFRNIAFNAGTFVAVGDAGYIATSPGVGWTQRASGGGAFYGVCYGDGYFVAVGSGGTIVTSPDGVTWSGRNSGTTTTLERVAWGGGRFVATGDNGLILQSAPTEPSLATKPVAGGMELDLIGGFDRAYGVEASTDLGSAANWSRLTTLTSGQTQFTDTDTSSAQKFYRVVFP